MNRYLVTSCVIVTLAMLTAVSSHRPASAHCQVPCGIYDDRARLAGMLEDVQTIAKAMGQIQELTAKSDALSLNQAGRWISTKEAHASHIITTVSEYFLTQKLPKVESGSDGYQDYLKKLAAHHKVLRAAMKTKQTVDPANADALKKTVMGMGKLWRPRPKPRSGS